MNECIDLKGVHPYYAGLGPVSLSIPFWAELPGHEVTYLADAPKAERMALDSWTLLAGPFVVTGEASSAVTDRRLLLGLMWDLSGQPLHPALPPRDAATFVMVWQDRREVLVYRATREMKNSIDEDLEKLRTLHAMTVRGDRSKDVAA
jgi:hypothetical protein